MRLHHNCADCGEDMSCDKVIWVYQGWVAESAINGEWYCPFCLLALQGRGYDLEGLYCRECGGTADAGNLQEAIRELGYRPRKIGSGDSFFSLNNLDTWTLSMWPYREGGRRTPTPPAPSIKLEPGELRCGCNNCENLRVG